VKIIAIVSAKGGVGKTTVTSTLSDALRYRGNAVSTVDLDPQNALRFHFGLNPQDISGISRATLAGQPWAEVGFRSASGVLVLPFGSVNEADRDAFEDHLDANPRWLRDQLGTMGLDEDDIVVLDTPPGPSVYMRQALSTASVVVIVTLPDAASYATLPMMEGLVQTYCTRRPDFSSYSYVINQVDNSRQLAKDVVQVMNAKFGDRVIGLIHQDPSVSEALAYDKSVLDYDDRCQATKDFVECADRLAGLLQYAGHAQ
jgi:cellulose synthase operon protein YhjQ